MATIHIPQGKLKGGEVTTENGFEYYEYRKIPYAKPPLGDLRFKSPQTADGWENERDATVSAHSMENIAMQINFQTREIAGSEDCLYLNVYTPKVPKSTSELLPVMVYIHGGGFFVGNGINKDESGPDFLIENNVVVVSINYRLGLFGFLSLDIPEAAGNMGLKDQIKALEWIQNNISHFGGDKNNVTLFGMSAGSASVEYLLISPLAKGLFHKAIMQSGSPLNSWAINTEPKKLIINLLNELGYKGSTEDNSAIHQFLLNIPAPALTGLSFKVIQEYTSEKLCFGFVPTIEKDFGNGDAFITKYPYKYLKEGNFNRMPILRGFCKQEGSLVTLMKPLAIKGLVEDKKFTEFWPHTLDSEDSSEYNTKLKNIYLEEKQQDGDEWAVDFFGDLYFTAGILISGKIISNAGVPIHMYKFSYAGNININKLLLGINKFDAGHGDESTYVLHHKAIALSGKINEADKFVRKRITKMWTNFSKFGDPTPEDCQEVPVKWPQFTSTSPVFINIDKEFTIETDYEPKKIAIFEDIYVKYEK